MNIYPSGWTRTQRQTTKVLASLMKAWEDDPIINVKLNDTFNANYPRTGYLLVVISFLMQREEYGVAYRYFLISNIKTASKMLRLPYRDYGKRLSCGNYLENKTMYAHEWNALLLIWLLSWQPSLSTIINWDNNGQLYYPQITLVNNHYAYWNKTNKAYQRTSPANYPFRGDSMVEGLYMGWVIMQAKTVSYTVITTENHSNLRTLHYRI